MDPMPPDRLERSTTPPAHARPLINATLGPQWLMESLIHRSTGKNLPTHMVNISLRPPDRQLPHAFNHLKYNNFPGWHGFR
jgi:hypothetical protein